DGRSTSVSFHELFENAQQIADLAVPPHERISILRLLVCITQAAHGAPESSDDWPGWDEGLESSVAAYLTKWQEHFNLMGDGPRFLQAPITEDGTEPAPTAKIVFNLATGNSVTLLDHEGNDAQPRTVTPAAIARAILTYQNHFDCDFMGQSPAFKGAPVAGTAIHAQHSFLMGENLRKTILLNCIDAESLHPSCLGHPIWEGGKTSDYLHRLVSCPCKLWLVDDGKRIHIHKGHQYGKYSATRIRETSATVIVAKIKGVPTPMLLKAGIAAALWRDLHCITVVQKSEASAPLTFLSHIDNLDNGEVSFWSGELVKTKGKVLDTVESVFTVPFELFKPVGQVRYQQGVVFAVVQSKRLIDSVKAYYANMMQRNGPTESAKRHFWNTLDQQSNILLTLLEGIATDHDPMGSADFGKGRDPWTLAVRAAADAAYEHTCPRGNPRQLQAYAAGLRVLRPLPKKSTAKKTPVKINS
ncbi:MAG: type I-E CRISPR-associated protein Cse1/CasA, partial [Luteolibacter sp.]